MIEATPDMQKQLAAFLAVSTRCADRAASSFALIGHGCGAALPVFVNFVLHKSITFRSG